MQPKAAKYLYDVQEACRLLIQFTSGKSLKDYLSDAMLRSAVERQFEIIGEAINQAVKLEPTLEPHITDCRRIVALRNILSHAYWTVAPDIVWGIIEKNLATLKAEVDALLRTAGP
jgi:uncharacterized protein with HEPN domain